MRTAAKIDANQHRIVSALADVGASVQTLAAVGKGCPDLLVGYRNRNYLLEIKDPARDGKAYKERTLKALTKDQHKWQFFWQGQVDVVWDEAEALRTIGATN